MINSESYIYRTDNIDNNIHKIHSKKVFVVVVAVIVVIRSLLLFIHMKGFVPEIYFITTSLITVLVKSSLAT